MIAILVLLSVVAAVGLAMLLWRRRQASQSPASLESPRESVRPELPSLGDDEDEASDADSEQTKPFQKPLQEALLAQTATDALPAEPPESVEPPPDESPAPPPLRKPITPLPKIVPPPPKPASPIRRVGTPLPKPAENPGGPTASAAVPPPAAAGAGRAAASPAQNQKYFPTSHAALGRSPRQPAAAAARAPEPEPAELEKVDARHQAARRFARLAVSEIILYREADVVAGREAKDLWTRLKPDLKLCVQTYEKRVAKEVRDRFDYLYDELVRQLGQGDPEKFGPEAPWLTSPPNKSRGPV